MERENNIEIYAKIQVDLLALREEVTFLYDIRIKVENCKEMTDQPGNPPPPTRVDLHLNIPRPGLSPESLDQLGLEKRRYWAEEPSGFVGLPMPPTFP